MVVPFTLLLFVFLLIFFFHHWSAGFVIPSPEASPPVVLSPFFYAWEIVLRAFLPGFRRDICPLHSDYRLVLSSLQRVFDSAPLVASLRD